MGAIQKFLAAFLLLIAAAPAATTSASQSPSSYMPTQDQMIDAVFADALARHSEIGVNQNFQAVARAIAEADGPAAAANRSMVYDIYKGILDKVDGEHWSQFEHHNFSIVKSLFRSQGVTTDNHGRWWYSSASSLLRTTSKGGMEREFKLFPLPKELKALKDNHIGDIDYADGKIYVGAEDGSKYLHPFIVVYDAEKLTVERYMALPHDLQPDGVPWVAADPANHRLYSAQYTNTTKLNVYDMTTLKPIGQIAMSRMITSIQGGKVYNGSIYMTADGDAGQPHTVFKMNLSTGTVTIVAQLPANLIEVEGLAFEQTPTGTVMNVLGVSPIKNPISKKIRRVEIFSFRVDQPSRRDQFRMALAGQR